MITPDFAFEKSLLPARARFVLGIDEVGIGSWAGPVVVGAFLLDLADFNPDIFIANRIRDSKTLSARQRRRIVDWFKQQGFSFQLFLSRADTIDKKGIRSVLIDSIGRAISFYRGAFDFVLIDGNLKIGNRWLVRSLPRGDACCFSIAAASICAKVYRDRLMIKFARNYTYYDFDHNMGYGTKKHLAGLKAHGICPLHRLSYKPVKFFANHSP